MKTDKARQRLFNYLDGILALSHEKFEVNNKKDETRLKWGRLMVQAIVAYGKLLDTEELEQRVAKLEEQIKDSVVIPNEQKQKPKRKNW